MIRSMTGFGRCQDIIGAYEISVEIKSVNHRYADFNIRIPRSYLFLEEPVKQRLQNYISRGKVDVFINISRTDQKSKEIRINLPLAEEYLRELRTLHSELDLRDDITVSSLARFNDLFETRSCEVDEEEIKAALFEAVDRAAEGFVRMREGEGSRMRDDMLSHCAEIEKKISVIEELSPACVTAYREGLEQRIRDLIGDASVDENRLLTETAIYADKLAVDEETVRLRSHLVSFREMTESGEAIGRKMDFLLQEMNREANTIGSKCNHIEISRLVVDIKSELEKIREQLQNIE